MIKTNDFTFAHRDEGFDLHIDKSIRGYQDMLKDVVSFSRYFVEDGTYVLDIGCSTGKLTDRIIKANKDIAPSAHYVGVEYAKGFQTDLKERTKTIKNNHDIEAKFLHADIRYHEFDYRKKLSFATSIFTLQFMPKRDREDVIKKVYDQLQPGGAFVFAEKVYCDNPQIQDMMTFMYYDHKKESFTCDDIMTKEKTLRHMLKPNTWDELKQFMYNAGFKDVQVFWRNFMFVGAIAIK